jgi:hypothetical protein
MRKPELDIQNHRIPCGPVSVAASALCRRRLRDRYDAVFDHLTKQIHPEGVDNEILEMEEEVIVPEERESEETDDEKKKRLISEGKLKAEVKHEVEKYKNKLMGNSKMLQDRTGKINKR